MLTKLSFGQWLKVKLTLNPFRLAISVAVSLITSAAFGQNQETSTINQLSELSFLNYNISQANLEANIAFETKKYRKASKIYIEILHHKPNDIQTLYNLAGCYSQLKKSEYAIKVLNQLINIGLNDLSLFSTDAIWNPLRKDKDFISFLSSVKILQKDRGESFWAESKIAIRGRLRRQNYDSLKAYPLLLCIHGYGSNPESFMPFRDEIGANDMFYASAQGPYIYKSVETNSPAYSWFLITQNKELWKRVDPFVKAYIINVIDEIRSHYKISNVYLLGHSQGGAVAYMTGIEYPDLIKGVICFGAQNPSKFLSSEELLNASDKLHLFISHGWADPKVNFNEAQEAKYLFQKYKFDITFRPFQGGHWLDKTALIEVINWLNELESKATP